MAKNPTKTGAAPAEIDDETYYRVDVSGAFRAMGVRFGTQSTTEVKGALLRKVLATEFATKITGYRSF
ncbi:hypothetical protein DNX69_10895 [Rhodopseudomonas palustris]|uniref:Uncharacterized protein n=1 Tax=Rhodopseudomonas palustris TaxID=1076 RepID=A0A323UK12_RHOPL|nr:hypothetical protein [Rhodopseudomonas palustris]PZA12473.1 hypothetical protein DNX69_10895 [Rhodopseudomonas palustris]